MFDLKAKFFNKLRYYKYNIYCYVSSLWAFLQFKLVGVDAGEKIKVWGKITIMRYQGSKIIIKDECSFRSDVDSNLLGINHRCILSTHSSEAIIDIEKNCGFSGTTIGSKQSIKIGKNVLVGANSIITDFDWHSLVPNNRMHGYIESKPIIIGDNVWIGANCIILKGVCIGENSVIGAGSIVTKNIPSNVIAAGNPCKIIKELSI